MKSRRSGLGWCGALACLAWGVACQSPGQWMTETYQLSNGWNAIYLRLTPWPDDLDTQLGALPVRAVHCFSRLQDTRQFSADSGGGVERGAEWSTWFPESSPFRQLTSLWSLNGNVAYIVECTNSCTWQVTGIPVRPLKLWLANDWNLAGLPVNRTRQVLFTEFFRHAPNLDLTPSMAGGKVSRTLPDGRQQDISSQTHRMGIHPQEAYWIKSGGLSAYMGTVMAECPRGKLWFPPRVNINTLVLKNHWGSNQAVTVRLLSGGAPPAGAPPRVGDVPLMYFDAAVTNGDSAWRPFTTSASLVQNVASGGQWQIDWAVDRSAMPLPPDTNATWQSVMEIADEGGTLIWLPVTAEAGAEDSPDALWPSGLWVGEVDLSRVNEIAADGVISPQPTLGPLTMRLILHVTRMGQVRLLQQAVMVWTYTVDDGVTSAYYRVFSGASTLPVGSKATRVSSVAFPYGLNTMLSGSFPGTLTGSYVIGYDDAANPFKHVYNPNHDNVDPDGEPLAEGMECYSITNTITLVLNSAAASTNHASLWNPEEEISGQYTHIITGLRPDPVQAEGRCTLRRVNQTGTIE